MAERHVVARTADIPEGGRLIVDVKGHSIGIFHQHGKYYALLNRCPHLGAELCRGDVVSLLESERPGEYTHDPSRVFLACPWHGWEFELETGQSYVDPRKMRVRRYDVSTAAGAEVNAAQDCAEAATEDGLTKGPYVAESFPIDIEDDYLVITLGAGSASKRGVST